MNYCYTLRPIYHRSDLTLRFTLSDSVSDRDGRRPTLVTWSLRRASSELQEPREVATSNESYSHIIMVCTGALASAALGEDLGVRAFPRAGFHARRVMDAQRRRHRMARWLSGAGVLAAQGNGAPRCCVQAERCRRLCDVGV